VPCARDDCPNDFPRPEGKAQHRRYCSDNCRKTVDRRKRKERDKVEFRAEVKEAAKREARRLVQQGAAVEGSAIIGPDQKAALLARIEDLNVRWRPLDMPTGSGSPAERELRRLVMRLYELVDDIENALQPKGRRRNRVPDSGRRQVNWRPK